MDSAPKDVSVNVSTDTEVTSGTATSPGTPTGSGSLVKDAAAEAMRKYKVKVDGQDLEVDEKELLKGYSHTRAANKILQEGKQVRRQAEEFINMMKDPEKAIEVLRKLGHDPRRLSESYLLKQIEDENMDPREREFRDAKVKLQEYETKEKLKIKEMESQRDAELKAKYAKDYSEQFVDALKTSGLPPTKTMVGKMAEYVKQSAKLGYKLSPSEAASLVKEDVQKAHLALLSESDGDTLMGLLGEQVANKVRKWDTSRVKDPNAQLRTPTEQNRDPRKRDTGSRLSTKEWNRIKRGF